MPEELKADVGKLGKRIKNMNAWLLDPKSKFMQTWDFFTLSALFFTLTVTPFEARAPHRTAPHRTAPRRAAPRRLTPDDDLGRPHLARRAREQVALLETKFDWLFVINWLVNLVFICDMVFNLI